MLDLSTRQGAHADQRLRSAQIVWITTVRPDGQPQTSPVWFWWDGGSFLILSQPGSQKVRNLRHQPRVSLHLDGDGRGGDIVTIEGAAELVDSDARAEYLEKYRQGIAALGYTPEGLVREFSTAIQVTPTRFRAW